MGGVYHGAARTVFTQLQITRGKVAARARVSIRTLALIFILLDGRHDHAPAAVPTRSEVPELIVVTHVRVLTQLAVMKLVTNALVAAFGVDALAGAGARNLKVLAHLAALVNVLRAVGASPAPRTLALIERARRVHVSTRGSVRARTERAAIVNTLLAALALVSDRAGAFVRE